jgi:DUF4097 and DUF4098 domain-containing protein YvlB
MTIDNTYIFASHEPRLEIENTSGSVEITTTTQDEVTVTIAADSRDAQEILDRATVRANGDLIEINIPNISRFRARSVDVRVSVPESASVKIRTASADVTTRGIIDRLSVVTVSGDVSIDTVTSSTDIKTVSGDVFARQASDVLTAVSTSGDIRIDAVGRHVTCKTVSGNCVVRAVAAGSIDTKSVSGDVTVLVEQGIGVDVAAQTLSGDLSSDIALSDQPGGQSSGPLVEIRTKTLSGDVRIRRMEVSAS